MQLVGSEPVFLPALHGASLLIGRLATVPVRATPTLPCRTACRAAHPYQPFPLQGTILRQQHPPGLLGGRERGPSGGGRPAAPERGHLQGWGNQGHGIVENPTARRGPQGPSLTVMGGLRHLFQSFYGSLDSEGRMELRNGLLLRRGSPDAQAEDAQARQCIFEEDCDGKRGRVRASGSQAHEGWAGFDGGDPVSSQDSARTLMKCLKRLQGQRTLPHALPRREGR